MVKLMAVLRTLFLVFMVLYAFKATPVALLMSGEARRGSVNVDFTTVDRVINAMWLAVAWIAIEVIVGWSHVWVGSKLRTRAAAKASVPPPPPPPPAARA